MTFTEILKENGISLAPEGHHHTRVNWTQFDCPFCSKNAHAWRMGYNQIYHYVNCWNCGSHRLEETLAECLNISWKEASKLLEGVQRQTPRQQVEVRGTFKPPPLAPTLLEYHRAYLKNRGFDPDVIERIWKIGSVGLIRSNNKLAGRIYIPIHYQGETVSFTTRHVPSYVYADSVSKARQANAVRYVSAEPAQEKVSHKKLLYGEDFCRHGISVHEGPMDAWAIGPGATCTFGLSYTQAQVARIAKYPIRVIAFDNEEVAQRVAKRLAHDLSAWPGETYNVTFSTKDSSRAPKSEINEFRKRFHLGEIE